MQPPPPSSDYPYRLPRIDDAFFQAAIPELQRVDGDAGEGVRGGRRGGGGGGAAGFSAAAAGALSARQDVRRGKRSEKSRNPVQRLKEALGRISAASAFASAPERSMWNPDAAFAASSADQGAFWTRPSPLVVVMRVKGAV